MEDLNNVPSSGTYGAAINEVNANFSLIVNAINSLEYATTHSKGIYNNGFTPSSTTLPNSVDGDWCMVLGTGNTFPARIWTFNGTTWAQGGTWNPDGINLNDYATTSALNTAVANSLAQATARMSYGEATASNNAYSVTITNYTLPANGGNIRVKMPSAATGAATLKIGDTDAKKLWYNGLAVTSENTWGAGEVISVYYDGTKYMASNSHGGGGNASKIKYDNSKSGLAATDAQGALDDVAGKVFVGEPIDYRSQTTYSSFFISGSAPYKWMGTSSSLPNYCRIVPISANTSYRITAEDNNPTHYALLRNNTPDTRYVATDWNGGAPKFLPAGESVQINSGEYTYLYVRLNSGSTASDFKYPKEIALLENVNVAIEEMQKEIEDTLGGDYLGTDMLEPGGVINNTGKDASEPTNVRTKYLPLGDATSVIIYNNKTVDGHSLYFKYAWYDANKAYKGYQTWTSATSAPIPASALGGFVRIVFARNPSATTTQSDIAQFELFLNIYGHDKLVKRVEALEAKEEDDDTSATAQIIKCIAPDSIKFCTWNIGHFSGGASSSSSITGSDYDTKLDLFRKLIYNTINPRVIALNEYSAVFGKDSNNVSRNAKDVLFNDFLIKYEGSQNNYSCNAMFASTYLVNMKMQKFDCLPHETIAGGYQDDYYYIIADLYMAGRLIKLVSSHFANTKQADQASELVSKLSSYDRVIVTGDLNTYGSSLQVFTNNGYTIGNTNIYTHKVPNPTMPLDNIIYKGVVVSDIRAIDSTLSDHYPLVATITV